MIENLLLDGAMLVLTLFLMRKRIYYGRVVVAATLGAFVSTFMLIIGLQFGLIYIVILCITGMVMMRLCMKQKKWNELIQGVVYYFALVFSYAKIHQVSEWLIGGRVNGIVLVLLAMGVMGVALLYMTYQNHRNRQKPIYYVELTERGKSVELKALLDTGNALREPFSGKPVSIVESNVWHNIVEECAPEKFKVIPFHSIGQEHGMLQGTEIEKLIIRQDDREIVQKNAIIAFYEGNLSNDKSYQMILHQSLLL
ncbi:MAG: sigma-E processing peptidase SpoIIGA [Lachnospiraceae bacterium]|nr:sigma-E processing peptidase SpoIIGA [Lachnospiraceae bacterium]